MPRHIQNVCVYCASSQQAQPIFYEAAAELGQHLAKSNITITYGGGGVGLMGAIANAALDEGGKVIGVLPEFMQDRDWGHTGLTELIITSDMHERKARMIRDADAVIALPGGCGTLEELLEAITWKQLALHDKPIVMLNTSNFFDPLVAALEKSVSEKLMPSENTQLWTLVAQAAEVLPTIDANLLPTHRSNL